MHINDETRDRLLSHAWASLFTHTPDFMFIKDAALVYVGASESFAVMTGAKSAQDIVGRTDADVFSAELAARYTADDLRVISTGEAMTGYVEPLPDLDGRARHVNTNKYPIRGDDGTIIGLLGLGTQITEDDTEMRLELEARRMAQPETIAVAVIDLDTWRVISFRSHYAGEKLAQGASASRVFAVIADRAAQAESKAWIKRMAEPDAFKRQQSFIEYRYLRLPPGEDTARYAQMHLRVDSDPQSGHKRLLMLLCDVHGETLREQELRKLAETDGITGFLNHDAMLKRIDESLRGDRKGSALIMIDIDGFKLVNDRLGHQQGDAALASIAQAIRANCAPEDILGRVGGDEFMVLMRNTASQDAVYARTKALNQALDFTCEAHGKRVHLSASLGVAMASDDMSAADEWYDQADQALYAAKNGGKNRCAFYTPPSTDASTASVHEASSRAADARLAAAQDALRFERERYALVIGQMGGLIWEVDIPKQQLIYTAETARALGIEQTVFTRSLDESLNSKFLHPDWTTEYRRLFDDLYAGVEGGKYTLRMRMADGAYHFMRVGYAFIRDHSGKPVRAIGIAETMPGVESDMRAFDSERRFEEVFGTVAPLSAEINITRNRVERCSPLESVQIGDAVGSAYDALLRRLHARTDPPGALARASFEAAFASGQRYLWISLDGLSDHGAYSAQLHVLLMRQPVCGDLYAYVTGRRDNDLTQALSARRDPRTALCIQGDFPLMARVMISRMQSDELLGLCVARLTGLRDARDDMADVTRVRVARLISILMEQGESACALPDGDFAILRPALSERDQAEYGTKLRARIMEIMSFAEDAPHMVMALGYAVERAQTAQYDTLLHRARMACESAMRWAENPVVGYLDASKGISAPETKESSPSLLIVDDDSIARRILLELLKPNYTVIEAEDGVAALEALQRHSEISLVLLDLIMPRLDGWHVLERLRDMGEAAPGVIVITADSDTENVVRALDNGALDVVGKPYQPRIIFSRVRSALSRAAAARAVQKSREYELRVEQQAHLLRATEIDEVTGLLNRSAFYRAVDERLRGAKPDEQFILLRLDIDRFKVINDLYGKDEGDRFLRGLGQWLTARLGGSTMIARLERDHFVCFASADAFNLETIASEYGQWLREHRPPLKLFGSMGAYKASAPFVTPTHMCDRALLALRTVKSGYATRAALYADDMRAELIQEQQLTGEIEGALNAGQFLVYYQPQYDMVSGELVGAEALVRWKHPARGMVSPGVFIPMCERNDFIRRLDEYVWRRACALLKRRRDAGMPFVPISVNLSRRDFIGGQLDEALIELVREYDLQPHVLRLEITETAYMDNPEELLKTVMRLRTLGFYLEMDDFGSGFSSLNTLKNVPVDMLKLDMRFLESADAQDRGGVILDAIVQMARRLELPLIAEGVETQAQAEYLQSIGCSLAQGYLYGRPMSEDAFEALLDTSRIP